MNVRMSEIMSTAMGPNEEKTFCRSDWVASSCK
jgi:hypothetical protein